MPPPVLSPASSPSKGHEEFSLVVPIITGRASPPREEPPVADAVEDEEMDVSTPDTPSKLPQVDPVVPASPPQAAAPTEEVPTLATPPRIVEAIAPAAPSPARSLEVYEDPFTREQQATPKPIFGPVLEDRSVNEDAAMLQQAAQQQQQNGEPNTASLSPEKLKQNLRLLDSGISKVQQKSLDVHGFRKLQGIIRDNSDPKSSAGGGAPPLLTDDKFDALVAGLFDFLESPLVGSNLPPEKTQDVKAQVLATIKLLLKRMRPSFQPHVSRGLESLLRARAAYESRTHIVSGLELLAADLAALGDASEIVLVLSRMLVGGMEEAGAGGGGGGGGNAPGGADRSLSMGLHVLKEMIDARGAAFTPSDAELAALAGLAGRCLESLESGVRMDAVLLCVALHARVGDARFWEAVKGVKEDPKSLITYYIVRRQRESGTGAGAAVVGQAA
jgi:CLIP-associating protein 1/2